MAVEKVSEPVGQLFPAKDSVARLVSNSGASAGGIGSQVRLALAYVRCELGRKFEG